MARIALGLLSLALLLGASGCTWTQTYSDYPPGLGASDEHHHHHEPPDQVAE
jgi:hypothetical protein